MALSPVSRSRRSGALLLLLLVTLAPLALLAYYTVTITTDALARQAQRQADSIAETSAVDLQQRFWGEGGAARALTDFVQTSTVSGDYVAYLSTHGQPAKEQAQLQRVQDDLGLLLNMSPHPQRAYFTNVFADVVARRVLPPARDSQMTQSLWADEWFKQVSMTGMTFIAGHGGIGGSIDGEPHTVPIATPIRDKQRNVIGYLAGAYSIEWAQSLVDRMEKDKGTAMTLRDQSGHTVVSPPGPASGSALSATATVPEVGWTVEVEMPTTGPVAAQGNLRTTLLMVDGFLSVLLLTGTVIGVLALQQRQLTDALRDRNETMKRLDEAALIAHSLRGQAVLDRLAAMARDLGEADFSGLTVLRRGRGHKIEAAARSAPEPLRPKAFEELAALLDERFGPAQPARLADVSQLYSREQATGLPPLGPLVTLPLLAGSHVLGRLVAARRAGAKPFDETSEGLLRLLTQHAVTAIEKSRQEEEREAFLEQLSDKNRELEQASRLKSEFLANMSHELRTPLSAIIGFSDLLIDGADGELAEAQAEDVILIQQAGRSLLGLINDILDLSKIEAGRMTLEMGSHQLGSIVKTVLAGLRPLAEAKTIYLLAQIPGELAAVSCDEIRVQQVVTNLVSNAIKFTENGGVTIRCRELDGWVEVSVVDTGIGIKPDAVDRIFHEFTQADSGTTRKYGGTGLGLAISRKLIELQGGQIGVESVEGRGSRFWFTLRQTPAPLATPPAAMPSPVHSPNHDLVLVIDDEPATRQVIVSRLGEAGFRTVEADGAQAALRQAFDLHPAAITLDVRMPGTDGWSVLSALKSNPLTRDIPVVMVSLVDGRETALNLGAASYLAKPFSRKDLLGHVQAVLPSLRGADVLCIDDEPAARDRIARSLSPLEVTVRLAASAAEGLMEIDRRVPDVVLVDLMMPEITGFELVAEMRSRPALANVPIIVLSAHELTPEEVALLSDQVDRFIAKSSLTTGDLASTLRQVIDTRRNSVSIIP